MSNELISETSPYLKQHAHNPVHWKVWNPKNLEKAQQEQKLILVSIGYSACHWCHVMEKECFEDQDVASLMNKILISIKVDREERPDVDSFFMDALLLMNGNGGWPLNVICLPDGRPVYGGTYFPKNKWLAVLSELQKLWKNQPQKMLDYADNLMNGLENMELFSENKNHESFDGETYIKCINNFRKHYDHEHGGFGQAPKFPTPWNWICLNRSQSVYLEAFGEKNLDNTLLKMAQGGIFDHLVGGFSRYSTDEQWHIPHFEKMLYDNAQMIQLYAEAWKNKPHSLYKHAIFKTLDFLETELMSENKTFYSALDADSENEEGKFYVWTKNEFMQIIGDEHVWIADFFDVTVRGNWEEGKNVLRMRLELSDFIKIHPFFADKIQNTCSLAEILEWSEIKIEEATKNLLAFRNQRIRPGLDDKIITSWNGLLIRAYIEVLKIWPDERRTNLIQETANYFWENVFKNQKLFRIFKHNQDGIDGFLDDYANFIDGLIALFELTGKSFWFERAEILSKIVEEKFYDEQSGNLFYTAKDSHDLLVRKTEIFDSVMPSSTAIMLHNWLTISMLNGDVELKSKVEKVALKIASQMAQVPNHFACWIDLYRRLNYPEFEVIITGEHAKNMAQTLQSHFIPSAKIFFSNETNSIPAFQNRFQKETLAYICHNQSCLAPIHNLNEILKIIKTVN